ncbi:holo-ACP synthase [Rickettsia endosymbiont of Cardiosporidium cionae]|uniref:holo-ACP synthase n=1 Tax=Rickettsia endosymbiont of Cardiosporidium cionae TaxID=2777155 RepID=UPI001894287D|nr:holo-ACP synthase [Rickettsia endosymbiont of Cardiosporidium cionae]KAF8818352.1 holo-ACP synthase [Rickettsia endosymbiont of Cardiosporidium cionae]
MILGIGTDIVSIDRISNIYCIYRKKFLTKLLHSKELLYYDDISGFNYKMAYIAKRFAAKEAVAKALYNGIGRKNGPNFREIAVLNDDLGKPFVVIDKDYLVNFNYRFNISLSDEKSFAIAMVVVTIDQ